MVTLTPGTAARRARIGLALVPAIVAIGLLAACTPGTTPTASPTAAPSDGPSDRPSADPEPTPVPAGTPIPLSCEQLLTADDVYAFNPNFGTAPDYSPTSGSGAAAAVDDKGLACGWLNQTSGELIEIAVAKPSEQQLSTRKNDAAVESSAVPTYGTPPEVDGFFTKRAGSGEAQVFRGKYWVVASSPAFFEPGDVQPLIAAVLSHLP
ncbi:iron ABC transporter ATP-binding protein [Luethyella okanaganae]|uniref:Iron ABC transporter ATP-binding protein n=1 Tax=Luethyella okanaganae TaxID=69372 RepID=A0ABW1VL48_9MICO